VVGRKVFDDIVNLIFGQWIFQINLKKQIAIEEITQTPRQSTLYHNYLLLPTS